MRIWILFLGFIGLVALSLIAVPVHFDEAQYTTWLRYQDLSYQTKGPLVTAVQSVTHGFEFLPQLVQVRLPAWIAWFSLGFLLLWLGRLAGFDQDASRRLLILYVTSPMLFVLGMVHTTDIWLLFFMLLALCAFASILHCRPNQQTELWWLLMGAALGFGALAKLSIALVPLSLFVWVILRTPRLIVTPGPYLGALLCGFVMTPWILWNVDRDFAHLSHEFGHVNSANDHWFHTVDWIPLLLLATLPVILLSLFGGLRMRLDDLANEREEAVRDMLRFSFGVLILLFVLKGDSPVGTPELDRADGACAADDICHADALVSSKHSDSWLYTDCDIGCADLSLRGWSQYQARSISEDPRVGPCGTRSGPLVRTN